MIPFTSHAFRNFSIPPLSLTPAPDRTYHPSVNAPPFSPDTRGRAVHRTRACTLDGLPRIDLRYTPRCVNGVECCTAVSTVPVSLHRVLKYSHSKAERTTTQTDWNEKEYIVTA